MAESLNALNKTLKDPCLFEESYHILNSVSLLVSISTQSETESAIVTHIPGWAPHFMNRLQDADCSVHTLWQGWIRTKMWPRTSSRPPHFNFANMHKYIYKLYAPTQEQPCKAGTNLVQGQCPQFGDCPWKPGTSGHPRLVPSRPHRPWPIARDAPAKDQPRKAGTNLVQGQCPWSRDVWSP